METLIVFEAGLHNHREFWLKGLSEYYEILLLQPWGPTWEVPYINSYIPCSFEQWPQELERLTALFKGQDITGIICLNEGTVNFTADLQKALNLPITHDLADPRVIRNKLSMRSYLHENGIQAPRTYKDGDQFNYPVIVKPTEFMASMGVTLARNEEELRASVNLARTVDIPEENLRGHYHLSDDVVIEEYIEGEEFSLESWVQNGNVLNVQVTKKIKVAPPFFYETGHISNAVIPSNLRSCIEKYVTDVVKKFRLRNGLFHFEVMIKGRDIYTVELAARPGGGMIPYLYMLTTTLNYPKILGDIMSGKILSIDFSKARESSAVFFPFGQNLHPDELQEEVATSGCKVVAQDYDHHKKSHDLSVRLGQIILEGSYFQLLKLLENLNRKCSHVV